MVRILVLGSVVMFGAWAARADGHRCAPLTGSEDQPAQADVFADQNITALEMGASEVSIHHNGAPLPPPETIQLEGIEVVRTLSDDEPGEVSGQAILHLHGPLADLCADDEVVVQSGDNIGQHWQVVSVGPTGILLLGDKDNAFAWLPEAGAPPPEFEVVWHSDFNLVADPKPKKVSARKNKRKRAKKRRKRRR